MERSRSARSGPSTEFSADPFFVCADVPRQDRQLLRSNGWAEKVDNGDGGRARRLRSSSEVEVGFDRRLVSALEQQDAVVGADLNGGPAVDLFDVARIDALQADDHVAFSSVEVGDRVLPEPVADKVEGVSVTPAGEGVLAAADDDRVFAVAGADGQVGVRRACVHQVVISVVAIEAAELEHFEAFELGRRASALEVGHRARVVAVEDDLEPFAAAEREAHLQRVFAGAAIDSAVDQTGVAGADLAADLDRVVAPAGVDVERVAFIGSPVEQVVAAAHVDALQGDRQPEGPEAVVTAAGLDRFEAVQRDVVVVLDCLGAVTRDHDLVGAKVHVRHGEVRSAGAGQRREVERVVPFAAVHNVDAEVALGDDEGVVPRAEVDDIVANAGVQRQVRRAGCVDDVVLVLGVPEGRERDLLEAGVLDHRAVGHALIGHGAGEGPGFVGVVFDHNVEARRALIAVGVADLERVKTRAALDRAVQQTAEARAGVRADLHDVVARAGVDVEVVAVEGQPAEDVVAVGHVDGLQRPGRIAACEDVTERAGLDHLEIAEADRAARLVHAFGNEVLGFVDIGARNGVLAGQVAADAREQVQRVVAVAAVHDIVAVALVAEAEGVVPRTEHDGVVADAEFQLQVAGGDRRVDEVVVRGAGVVEIVEHEEVEAVEGDHVACNAAGGHAAGEAGKIVSRVVDDDVVANTLVVDV